MRNLLEPIGAHPEAQRVEMRAIVVEAGAAMGSMGAVGSMGAEGPVHIEPTEQDPMNPMNLMNPMNPNSALSTMDVFASSGVDSHRNTRPSCRTLRGEL